MDLISFTWLVWIGATTLLFWILPAKLRFGWLLAVTCLFLLTFEPTSLGLLAVLTGTTYFLTKGPRPDGKRVALAIVPVAALLFGYKIFSASQGDDLVTTGVIPLGLSYYTLRCIHYAMERYKGAIRDLGPWDLLGYLFFIPTIFIGPIHRFPEWRRDKSRHRWDSEMFSEGLERILHGYVKVAFFGNFLVSDQFASWSEDATTPGSAQELYLEMIRIGLNLWFQFSGFSDLAIGFARLLGFRVMENFNWPFFQRNISDFWANWHISLTSWSREYVFNPTIAVTRSPAAGALASLIAIALWHEVSVRYLVWGLYHGLGIVVWQKCRPLWGKLPQVANRFGQHALHGLSVLVTAHFVLLGFLLVRQEGFGEIIDALQIFGTGWT